jgi:uncharacterized LabA/DUF88 family protein
MSRGQRAIWLVDGFNLYHSIRRCEQESAASLRWLNLRQLAENAQSSSGSPCEVGDVRYFTALPHHLAAKEPERLERHRAYLRALTAWRPSCAVTLGHFQPHRESSADVWREKGTDMAIAAEAVRVAMRREAEEIVILSGDSDFAPLALLMAESFPNTRLRFAFPAHRASRRLRQLCPGSFHLRPEAYARAQFPREVALPSGKFVRRPTEWSQGG